MKSDDLLILYFSAVTLMVIGMAILALVAGVPARRTGWTTFATGAFLLIAAVVDIMARTYLDG